MELTFPLTYAVKHIDEDIRAASRSGGVFTALSDEILNNNGVVYGCILNDAFEAVHVRADSSSIRNKMRGSKYVQSNIGNVFIQIKEDLIEERFVLFSGTSCQIAGLKSYLNKEYEKLLCVDILCHGVPSPMIWKKYLEWQENKYKGTCIEVDFRNKRDYGWASHMESIFMDINGKKKQIDSNIFTNLFYEHSILRPSCYYCPYKGIEHPADITIADYWGIEKAAKGFDDNKGVSLVLVNNEHGKAIFDNIIKTLIYEKTNIQDSIQMPLVRSVEKPQNRDDFWKELEIKGFSEIVKKYAKSNLIESIKLLLKNYRRRIKNWRNDL